VNEARRQGIGIARGAVSILKELFEDVGELAAEAEKLACFCVFRKIREISEADVEEFCMSDGSRNMLRLLDGLCAGHSVESLTSLNDMSGRSELLPLLSALHNRFRLALYFAVFPGDKANFARALGAKDYAMRNADSAARKYGSEKLSVFVTGLIRITSNERIGQGAAWRDLSLLVIDLLS
jgi:DNA polymerase-3 subunit delta